MLQIIIIGAGLFFIFKGKIRVDAKRELLAPHAQYLGVIFVASVLITFVFSIEFPYIMIFVFAIPLIASIFFIRKARAIEIKNDNEEKREVAN